MAEERFDIIDERPVATVPVSLAKRGAALEARKDRLDAQLKKLSADIDAFEEKLGALVPSDLQTDMAEGLRIGPDGTLFQMLCKCVECQAKLHGMGVVECTEAMIRSGAVPKSQVADTRRHAYELEQEQRRDSATRLLFN